MIPVTCVCAIRILMQSCCSQLVKSICHGELFVNGFDRQQWWIRVMRVHRVLGKLGLFRHFFIKKTNMYFFQLQFTLLS